MNILLLCDRVPSGPSDGLLLRVLALARELARDHTIDLLCLRTRANAEPVDGLFRRAWAVAAPPPRPPASRLGPLGGWGPESLYVPSPDVAHLLERVIDPEAYDVVWDAGAVLFTQLPPRWAGKPVVADLVDDMVLTFRRAAATAPRWIDRLRNLKYAHVFGRFERETMRRCAHCVVVSDEDAASFARVSPRVPVSVVANGVDTAYYAPDGTAEVAGRLVFEGTMSFPPNEQAAIHLVREVMPLVWSRRPDASVALVGRDPGPALQALAEDRVIVTGSVPDVRRYVLEAQVFVCPLLSGAGIKNKLLQAWAMSRPVVATKVSIGGLDARDGTELVVRDDPAGLAQAVLDLLDDPVRRASLGHAGRQAAIERFAWRAMADRLQALLGEASGQNVSGALPAAW